jgi:hypothetical protein
MLFHNLHRCIACHKLKTPSSLNAQGLCENCEFEQTEPEEFGKLMQERWGRKDITDAIRPKESPRKADAECLDLGQSEENDNLRDGSGVS